MEFCKTKKTKKFHTELVKTNKIKINKHFHSGRKIEVNDLVLFAMLNEQLGHLTLISLHEDELENYETVLEMVVLILKNQFLLW